VAGLDEQLEEEHGLQVGQQVVGHEKLLLNF
jgi:hypothetical protein